ncbi:MAG: hypothetical protein KBG15_17705 [Kofleriaceae bacterium]|nr:hypothetical protein [Kofleriaceae bacterium]
MKQRNNLMVAIGAFAVLATRGGCNNATPSASGRGSQGSQGGAPEAFTAYKESSQRIEAELMMRRVVRRSQALATAAGVYVVGATLLSPAVSCCEQNVGGKHQCAADPTAWQDPIWRELDFAMEEPHYFQYQYTGTATSYKVTAVGDLDCDGTTITFAIDGNFDAGNPTFYLTKPGADAD